MGGLFSKKTDEEEVEPASFALIEPISPVAINKYDQAELKNCINECISALLEEQGMKENHYFINIKIVIGFVSVAIALAS